MSLRKKSFTLIEMLIVVVIIGILAAALIPRLQGVQGRARDVQRKTGLSQIGQGMSVFKSDNGDSYVSGISTFTVTWSLVPSYLASIPTDPSNKQYDGTDFGGTTSQPTKGSYGAWTTANGDILVLGAMTEIRGSSNAVQATFTGLTTMSGIQAKVVAPASSVADGTSTLRYYYVQ